MDKKAIKNALEDKRLERALENFYHHYMTSRQRSLEETNFEFLRIRVGKVKLKSADNLDKLVKKLEKRLKERGIEVFVAKDGKEAGSQILKICKKSGGKKIIKVKSMATEEIHLNETLEREGFSVWETDLGEWIVQLAKEKPSHILAPAIHFTRYEVSELFSEKFEKVPPEPEKLVKVARKYLREVFFGAEIGICGANIAVAEEGFFVILTNEGNGRMVLTLPETLIVLVPFDKLVEKKEDAIPILRLLPRNATGQRLSCYVSLFSLPQLTVQGKPKKIYVILLDNGRSKIAKDPVFRELFKCIRCAACLNVCPVFRTVGGHVFGDVYTGPIGVLLTAFIKDFEKGKELAELCLQCGRCKEVCAGGIDLPHLILELKNRDKKNFVLRKSLSLTLSKPEEFLKIGKPLLPLAIPFVKRTDIFKERKFLKPSSLSFTQLFKEKREKTASLEGLTPKRILFYSGCLVEFLFPEMGRALERVLNFLGYEMVIPERFVCCGAPAYFNGMEKEASNLLKLIYEGFLTVWKKEPFEAVLSMCPTCVVMLKKARPLFLNYFKNWKNLDEVFTLSSLVKDATSFVWERLKNVDYKVSEKNIRVTYHDSCHLKRELKVWKEPREIITFSGAKLLEMESPDECCGFGGSFFVKFPEVSQKIFKKKEKEIEKLEVSGIIADCPGCIYQFKTLLKRKCRVSHSLELLAEVL